MNVARAGDWSASRRGRWWCLDHAAAGRIVLSVGIHPDRAFVGDTHGPAWVFRNPGHSRSRRFELESGSRTSRVEWMNSIRRIVAATAVWALAVTAVADDIEDLAGAPGAETVYVRLPPGQTTYGGPLRMTDHHGRPFDVERLRGRYALLYFGYTDCPDVCPMTLVRVSRAIAALGARGEGIVPVFVNVDPVLASDMEGAIDRLAAYVGFFDPRMIGLTGDRAQIERVKDDFEVYFAASGEGANRRISHSSNLYLLDPGTEVIAYLHHGVDAEDLAEVLDHLVDEVD